MGKDMSKGLGKKKAIIISALLLLAVATAAIIFVAVGPFGEGRQVLQSKFSIDYSVSFEDFNVEVLDVDIEINISKLSKEKIVYLLNTVDTPVIMCEDEYGTRIPYNMFESIIAIGPIDDGVKTIKVEYPVKIGDERDPYSDAPPYKEGCLYEDLLVFTGEKVLLAPFIDPVDMMATQKYIDRVSFSLSTESDWQAILPYQSDRQDRADLLGQPGQAGQLDQSDQPGQAGQSDQSDQPTQGVTFAFSISKPGWGVFNRISKSPFCFGNFDKIDEPLFSYYVDKGVADAISDDARGVLHALMAYYGNLFGSQLENPPVFLRNAAGNGAVILGGVGSGGSAVSINIRDSIDFETLSSTIFHAFFDSKVRAPNLRYAPHIWVYSGLSDYYVVKSAESLPARAAAAYAIELNPRLIKEMQYLRYLYFSLKETGFLVIDPSFEDGMFNAQYEYYLGTKVPVMITAINDIIKERSGTGIDDGLLKSLVQYGGEEKALDMDRFLDKVCGRGAESVRKYFSGGALVPVSGYNYADNMFSREEIAMALDEYEYGFHDTFSKENVNYPYFGVILLNEGNFRSEAEKLNVHYNTGAIESQVKSFSNTLDQILLQYAARCKLAGFDDITAPEQKEIKQKLQEEENMQKWMEFCERVGIETDAGGY